MSSASKPKITKIGLREDRATGLTSSIYGANLDCIAFNISYISTRKPQLAEKILSAYEEARELEEDGFYIQPLH